MNRIESLGTARIALSVALVMVLGAILVPLPRPARPVVASRSAGAKEDKRRPAPAVQPAVPGAASAPRLAVRDDERTAGDATPTRTALRDPFTPKVNAVPLHPIAEERPEKPRETLPPHPAETASDTESRARKPKANPFDDTRPGAAEQPAQTQAASAPDERLVRVNVVLNRDVAQAASGDAETIARLEGRLEMLQQRLDELTRIKAAQSNDESREATNKLLERVEHMVSMTEIQRKIDSLQSTLEETKRAHPELEQGRAAQSPASPNTAAVPTPAAPVQTEQPSREPEPAVAKKEASESEKGAPGAGGSGLPQILPGPPFFPRPGERNVAAPRDANSRLERVRQALGPTSSSSAAPAETSVADESVPFTQVTQAARRSAKPEAGVVAPEAAAAPEEDPGDLSAEPEARESACYAYQLALRCMGRGELLQARAHVRKAIAYDPTLQAPRKLSEQIDEALRGLHRSGRPINGAPAMAPPGRISVRIPEPIVPAGHVEPQSPPARSPQSVEPQPEQFTPPVLDAAPNEGAMKPPTP